MISLRRDGLMDDYSYETNDEFCIKDRNRQLESIKIVAMFVKLTTANYERNK